MAIFCKTSHGGFNLDNVTYWEKGTLEKSIRVYTNDGNKHVDLKGDEAMRVLAILDSVCIFDATKESK